MVQGDTLEAHNWECLGNLCQFTYNEEEPPTPSHFKVVSKTPEAIVIYNEKTEVTTTLPACDAELSQ